MKDKISLFWFRRDLRIEDNIGLYHALAGDFPVFPIFIYDSTILEKLPNSFDRRVDYIHQALDFLNGELSEFQTKIHTFFGIPLEIFKELHEKYDIQKVFCNRDYEPEAIQRDTEIYTFLKDKGIDFKAFKDQVLFDKKDVLKKDGTPYTVFTPYANQWKKEFKLQTLITLKPNFSNFYKKKNNTFYSLEEIGFQKTDIIFQIPMLDSEIIDDYHLYRDFPAMQKTTQLGIALRFGTISIRKCIDFADKYNQTWLSELIWREFFMQILYHFPHVVNRSFKVKYDNIQWRNNEEEFELWCRGETGYPIVDAGMRQLNQTGFMHNRVRMITASFLCKHLLIDWRWGESYFAQKLNDYDLSANNGNWQWAAGTGCDAAPYFRIFNPAAQTEKFDKEEKYINRWIPEYNSSKYVKPMVDHKFARERALSIYKKGIEEFSL